LPRARAGKLPTKDAAAFVSMFSQLLRAFEVADLEEQMRGLERDRALTELENGPNGNGSGAGRDFEPAPKGDGANGNGSLQSCEPGHGRDPRHAVSADEGHQGILIRIGLKVQ